ncbi:unnamed protein product [Acanthocheilonema viteae]|uniref:Uncharacterized protein n=1 Tax=Acanthocheilonema viteae TaxID=6277 RepID=A0A498SEF1_ACAVI|nr:unnamed protein product [Acanthocheilonema viteae]
MFYVFYVNEGSLQALEVSVALGSVHKLQCVIEEITRVPVAEQIAITLFSIERNASNHSVLQALLVSGGEGLQSEKQVSHYQGAGTESNPLFLFRKLYKEDSQCTELTNSDELCTLCAGLYDELHVLDSSTISRPLITRYCDAGHLGLKVAERSLQLCARLVQDHQLLHQGWLALISNLYDSRAQIEKKSERFLSRYERLKTMKIKAETLLQDFDNVLRTLQQIKIPSALLSNSYKLQGSSKATEECTLYEYIARADPQNSLEEMSEQVNILLSKTSDTEYKQVVSNMRYVSEKVSNPEMRNIRGINTRLTQLDAMFHNKEQETKVLKDLCFAVSQPVVDSQSTRVKFCFLLIIKLSPQEDIVLNQREKMLEVRKLIEQIQKMGKAFQQSKIELLNNIRTRLRGWILQVYDRLHATNNQIILFEEKYIALRNRLDIIRQVKESPTMFATALTECLRRSVLQPEFESWFASFMEKSVALVTEETSVREVFKQKLGRHFLKQLFPGMFDNFPNFAPSGLTHFDKNLPPVAPVDLRTLRQAVPCLANLLRVTDPFIYQRLSVRDPRLVSGSQMTPPVLKREESFYTTDATINVANLNKNFPSTHWLSGDENLDALPSNATMLAKSPPSRFGSTFSLDMVEESPARPLNSLASLFDASHNETAESEVEIESKAFMRLSVTKSEPIAIPQNNASILQVVAPLIEEGNSVKPKSDKSSQFGTPEDHISYHQRIAEVFERSQSGSLLCLQNGLKGLSQQLMHLKQELILAENQTKEYSDGALKRINNSLIAYIGYRNAVSASHQPIKPIYKDAAIETETKDKLKESFLMSVVDEVPEKDISELRQVIELQKREISQLREQQLSTENTVAKMEIERNEMYKTLVIDHELALERKISSHNEEMKRKNKEIDSLKAALHKLRETVVHQNVENTNSVANSETGISCDKEYEKKFITAHGNSLLSGVPIETKEKYSFGSEVIDSQKGTTVSSVSNDVSKGCLLKSFSVSDVATNMESSKVRTEGRDSEKDENTDEELKAQADSDEDIAPVTVRPATAQTAISLREMRTMITVQDIHEYCAVLIVWSKGLFLFVAMTKGFEIYYRSDGHMVDD